jgi:hypothetical protein
MKQTAVQDLDTKSDTTISEVYGATKVIQNLEMLMLKVTENECNTETVRAACSCVEAINGLLRTHLEQQRLNIEKERMRRSFTERK